MTNTDVKATAKTVATGAAATVIGIVAYEVVKFAAVKVGAFFKKKPATTTESPEATAEAQSA